MLFFEIKADDAHKLEHFDTIMFSVGKLIEIYKGQEVLVSKLNISLELSILFSSLSFCFNQQCVTLTFKRS